MASPTILTGMGPYVVCMYHVNFITLAVRRKADFDSLVPVSPNVFAQLPTGRARRHDLRLTSPAAQKDRNRSFFLRTVAAWSFVAAENGECGLVNITWQGGVAPYKVGLHALNTAGKSWDVDSNAYQNGQGFWQFQLPVPQGHEFVITMGDNDGVLSGGASPILTASARQADVPAEACNTTPAINDFVWSSPKAEVSQCQSYTFTDIGIDRNSAGNLTPPTTLYVIIPGGGGSFAVSMSSGSSYDWIANVVAGTTVVFDMVDSEGHQGGIDKVEHEVSPGTSGCSPLHSSLAPTPLTTPITSTSAISTPSASGQAPGATSLTNTTSTANTILPTKLTSAAQVETKRITPAVAGGAAAATVVGIALLILAFLLAKPLEQVFLLTGWLFFRRRRLNIHADKDVGQIQITLFLSPHEVLRDSDDGAKETLLAWQVHDIGHSRRDFNITCPCIIHTGDTKLGFGTVAAERDQITSEEYAPAPAIWADGQWEEHGDKSLIHPVAQNNGENMDISLGTFEDGKKGQIFKPFVLIRDVKKQESYTYQQGRNLYLHIFLTNGYREGRYADDLVSKFEESKLTTRGIKLSDLKPISQWHISKVKGKIVLAKIRGAKKGSNA
ncbi:hypothetical protein DL96DRAFT_1817362 [Flagelloscypha sp. PMI_526]|nr:hypothetical protein DL96DRAFT_1817362 [Flagelloscypha sp. PMI_526]